tara:strand:- start:163 stop:516 length:354 start_codon:yes stop_codon:yes gene_type:complete
MFPADSRRFDPKWEVRRVGVARGVLSALPSSRVSSKAQNRMGTIPQKRYINRTIELRMTARIFKIPAGDVREHEGLFVSRLLRLTLGFGTNAANRAMKSTGSKAAWVVPSRQGVFNV